MDIPFGEAIKLNDKEIVFQVAILVLVDIPFGEDVFEKITKDIGGRNPCSSGYSFRSVLSISVSF